MTAISIRSYRNSIGGCHAGCYDEVLATRPLPNTATTVSHAPSRHFGEIGVFQGSLWPLVAKQPGDGQHGVTAQSGHHTGARVSGDMTLQVFHADSHGNDLPWLLHVAEAHVACSRRGLLNKPRPRTHRSLQDEAEWPSYSTTIDSPLDMMFGG